MAQSAVRKATQAFIRGEGTAADVLGKVRAKEAPAQKSVEQITLETSEDFTDTTNQENTWADVARYWDMMTPAQQEELTAARKAKFGS